MSSFIDAFYHSMMTAMTIGLGDIAPHTPSGRLCTRAHAWLTTTAHARGCAAHAATPLTAASARKL